MTEPPPPGPGDARAVALTLLRAVLRRGRPLDEALAGDASFAALEPRDRGFARLIAATALRRLGQIDALIDTCLERPLADEAAPVTDILRIGAAQLGFVGTPPHAAVDRTVALVRGRRIQRYRALVNAVLRRLAREAAGLIADHDAARLNTPDWLWRSWSDAFGDETCRRIAESHLSEAPLDITVKGGAAIWAARLDAEPMATGTLRRAAGGRIEDLPGYGAGHWWIQDAAAALPAKILMGGFADGIAGRKIADLCAAPGGKTAQLAAAGGDVVALDISPARLEILRGNLRRLGLEATMIAADATKWKPETAFDAVLVDAPCSGTGVIRRHPDIARLKRPADVDQSASLQRRILDAAADMVTPGGVLVYAVCSLQTEEGERQIDAFLGRDARFERQAVAAGEIAGQAELLTAGGDVRSLPCHWPDRGGLDGFYIARLRRRAD